MTWIANGQPLKIDDTGSIEGVPTDEEVRRARENEKRMSPRMRAVLDDIDREVEDIERRAAGKAEPPAVDSPATD